jgi:hypothetical protein
LPDKLEQKYVSQEKKKIGWIRDFMLKKKSSYNYQDTKKANIFITLEKERPFLGDGQVQ